ncbi:MAG: hypothetical protein ACH350_02025 [Parachlamydiaceae bacterium]
MENKKLFKTTSFKFTPISYTRFLPSSSLSRSLDQSTEKMDADFFKRSISLHYQHAYASKKWQNWIYRIIFFGFGFLFLLLSAIIFHKTSNFSCSIYFKNCLFVKNSINILCLLLAGGAFIVGYKMHPKKEAIQYLIGKIERELNQPAKHLQIEFNAIISNLSHEWAAPHQTVWIKKALNPG